MKQKLLIIALLFSLSATAQKGGYFSLRGGAAFKDDLRKGIAHMSLGYSHNHIFGIGAGIGYIDFDKPYIPMTVDISFFGKPGKISPVVIGSAGYGIYEKTNPYFTTKGGFTGSLNVGGALPVKGYRKLFLTVGYALYYFNGGENVQTTGSTYKAESNIKMFTLTAGFKI